MFQSASFEKRTGVKQGVESGDGTLSVEQRQSSDWVSGELTAFLSQVKRLPISDE